MLHKLKKPIVTPKLLPKNYLIITQLFKDVFRLSLKYFGGSQYQKNYQPNQKVGRRPKETFLQRRHTDGQETHEKMLNISNYQRNPNQNYNEVSPHTSQNHHPQKILKTMNAGEDVEKNES